MFKIKKQILTISLFCISISTTFGMTNKEILDFEKNIFNEAKYTCLNSNSLAINLIAKKIIPLYEKSKVFSKETKNINLFISALKSLALIEIYQTLGTYFYAKQQNELLNYIEKALNTSLLNNPKLANEIISSAICYATKLNSSKALEKIIQICKNNDITLHAIKDIYGKTPLHIAQSNKSIEAENILNMHGIF